jgi:hypothetical protein
VSTLFESSGEFAGADPRASLWSPLPVYDEREDAGTCSTSPITPSRTRRSSSA